MWLGIVVRSSISYYLLFFLQSSCGLISDQPSTESSDLKMNCTTEEEGSRSLIKSDINLAAKSSRIRRASSIYTNVKRIISSRKTRPVTSHRMFKSQDGGKIDDNNPSSNMRLSSISVRKKLLKSADYIPSITSNVANIRSSIAPKISKHKRTGRKLSNNFKHEVTDEESGVVKQNSKRLKVVLPKFVKTRPEVGESSKTQVSEKATVSKISSRAFFLCNKQNNSKNIFGKVRKPFVKIEQTKVKKCTKMKLKRKNSLIISKLAGGEVNNEIQWRDNRNYRSKIYRRIKISPS